MVESVTINTEERETSLDEQAASNIKYVLGLYDKITQSTNKDLQRMSRAFGSVFGAFVGDSTGSYLEFSRKINITEKLAKEALDLNGGGPFRVGPGQMTDDSEMAMCILHGLVPEKVNKFRKCEMDTQP